MVKTVGIFVLLLGTAILSFSQTNSTKKAPAAQSAGASLSDDKLKMLTKAWAIDTVEQFGVAAKANAKEKNDLITLLADGTLFFTQEGTAATGTWKYAGGRLNIETKSPDNKISFKMISLADTRLVLEYQTPDLIKIKYTYKPKK
jgi:hypothetical protein